LAKLVALRYVAMTENGPVVTGGAGAGSFGDGQEKTAISVLLMTA